MTTRGLAIQAELVLNTTAAEASIARISRMEAGVRGRGTGTGGRRTGQRNTELFGLGREIGRGLGLGGLSGGALGLLGAGGALTAAIAGITALGVASHTASRTLGTSAYRDFRSSTIRLRHSWNLFAASIGDRVLPALSKLADFVADVIPDDGKRQRGAPVLPQRHAGGRIRESGAYNLRQGEEVLSSPSQGGERDLEQTLRRAFSDAFRENVQNGVFDILFDRDRLPSLIPQLVTVDNADDIGGAGGVDLVDVDVLAKTDFDALATKEPNILYLVHGVPSTGTGGTPTPGGGNGGTTPPPVTPSPPNEFTLSLPNPVAVNFTKEFGRPQTVRLPAVVRSSTNQPDTNQWTYSISGLPDGITFESSTRTLTAPTVITVASGTYPVTYRAIEVSPEPTPTTISITFSVLIHSRPADPDEG